MTDTTPLNNLCALIRHRILTMSTAAGSGHPTSSLSAVELMAALMFGTTQHGPIFRYDPEDKDNPANDRLIFSKGHASPLFYALWSAAGLLDPAELQTFRDFGGRLEGHPTPAFPYTEAATGSLGQGLSIGLGMALSAARLDKTQSRTFVLLGDSEMAEGSQYEAMQVAAHYRLENLVAVLDVNRLGQRGETMYGHDLTAYEARAEAFGWWAIRVEDGHDLLAVLDAYDQALTFDGGKPVMIIARTQKGKGVSAIENKDGWHGKALPQDMLEAALAEIGPVDQNLSQPLSAPEKTSVATPASQPAASPEYALGDAVAPRKAYGKALARLALAHPNMVVLDAEVSNSTYAEVFKETHPERFFEMFVAEQNMLGAALGLSRRGKKPCVSTFAAFLARAYDFIRMAQYSEADMLICGSHAGVSIGEDGASQMALEDLAFFRTILNGAVLYPSDAVSAERLVEEAFKRVGITYLRTTRAALPVLYDTKARFPLGGSKVLRESPADAVSIAAAGITVHEALKAADKLAAEGVHLRVIDCYSIKPLDRETLLRAAGQTRALITVEDHYAEGGLGEAVAGALATDLGALNCRLVRLAVTKLPRSGTPAELLNYEGISANAIISTVRNIL